MRALIAEKNWKFKFPSNMEAAISSQFLIVSRRSTWSMREFLHSSLFHFSFEVDWTWFHGRYLLSVIKYVAIDSETFHFKQFSQKKIWNYFFCSNVSIDCVSWWGAADWVHCSFSFNTFLKVFLKFRGLLSLITALDSVCGYFIWVSDWWVHGKIQQTRKCKEI